MGYGSGDGKELQEIAPTKVEQKRLMQIIKGSITANLKCRPKADKVRVLFDEMREELKEHNLLEYSRFDKLTGQSGQQYARTSPALIGYLKNDALVNMLNPWCAAETRPVQS